MKLHEKVLPIMQAKHPINLLGVVQIAVVGLTETPLKERGIEYLVADYPFDEHGKSILMDAKYGYVKVIADK